MAAGSEPILYWESEHSDASVASGRVDIIDAMNVLGDGLRT